MSFDTLTIAGILCAILSGGFLIALVSRNDAPGREEGPMISQAPKTAESQP